MSHDAGARRPWVDSEVAALREVVLHRPGGELRRLTPANKAELLFDELVWVDRAQQEHDALAETLAGQGVAVRWLTDLLTQALADPADRAALAAELVTADTVGVELVNRVRAHLGELDAPEFVATIIEGLTVTDVPGAGDGLVAGALGRMSRAVRRTERRLWDYAYAGHPNPAVARSPVWYGAGGRVGQPATIEGGDVLVLSPHCVAIGISERSHPVAAENLASALFANGVCEEVLAIDLPKSRTTMHLDTVLTVVDHDAVVWWPGLPEVARCWRITPGHPRLRVACEPDLRAALARGLGVDALRVVTTADDRVLADREQWDDGNNTLAVRPGAVIAYERNVDTNARLAQAGVTVFTTPSAELPRGRGGPRCLTCPLGREPAGVAG
ncbi:MAG: arginine deiminase [Actinobacteria bacterium QS_8_72_14]|nr:MAG: arginine deiminase [Actinobacteria bacterium QS_8_72_14]